MRRYIEIIEKSVIFKGLTADEIEKAVEFFDAKEIKLKKGEYIYHSDDSIKKIGLVLDGSVRIEKEDYYGNSTIMTSVSKGDIFGEVYSCCHKGASGVSVVAESETKVLMLDTSRIFMCNSSKETFYYKIMHNLINVLASKAYMLNLKIGYICKRTTREKLMSFLSQQAEEKKSNGFYINFNRQELADFLCVDRSAMSNELSKMKKEGIIEYNKNYFKLL